MSQPEGGRGGGAASGRKRQLRNSGANLGSAEKAGRGGFQARKSLPKPGGGEKRRRGDRPWQVPPKPPTKRGVHDLENSQSASHKKCQKHQADRQVRGRESKWGNQSGGEQKNSLSGE